MLKCVFPAHRGGLALTLQGSLSAGQLDRAKLSEDQPEDVGLPSPPAAQGKELPRRGGHV